LQKMAQNSKNFIFFFSKLATQKFFDTKFWVPRSKIL
jgi:hypothetical protein